jgi:Domain of unknown function (DUF4421)
MKSLCLLFLLLAGTGARADGTTAAGQSTAESEDEQHTLLEQPVTLGATLGFPNHLFSLGVLGAGDDRLKNIDYSPPQVSDLTLTAGYGVALLSWSFPMPQSSQGRQTYGKTKYNDFKFELGSERAAASLYFQSFSGFYTDLNGNTGNFARIGSGSGSSASSGTEESFGGSSAAPPDILKRPDIRSKHYGTIGWYAIPLGSEGAQAFDISFKTLPRRPHPGFDWNLIGNALVDRATVNGSSPLVPEKKAQLFGRGASLTGVDLTTAGVGAGVAGSYVFDSGAYYLDGLFLYGGGAQRQRTQFTDDFRWTTAYADNVNLRFGLNYKTEWSEAGLHFWVNTLGSRVSDLRFNSSNMALELSYQRTI